MFVPNFTKYAAHETVLWNRIAPIEDRNIIAMFNGVVEFRLKV